ncbi:hypothetical protein [Sinorhizobium meliloti]|uniref:hypothetical protein n=1 Tax=Rhizobium meliloti TaxID=382 RepID=UPI000FDB62D1|nr:hypothetical protein [Sinorhizobium meliloti]RVN04072.1 hypothetical protein CN112_26060 [Sinorhizobium meliloti]
MHVPENVKKAVVDAICVEGPKRSIGEVVALAIINERSRCADIAIKWHQATGDHVATAIENDIMDGSV